MTPDPWHAYDQWEARDRTLLEAAALARTRPGWREGSVDWRDGWVPPSAWQNLGTLDTVLAERYRSDSPDDQETP